jgi:hypothetical protein
MSGHVYQDDGNHGRISAVTRQGQEMNSAASAREEVDEGGSERALSRIRSFLVTDASSLLEQVISGNLYTPAPSGTFIFEHSHACHPPC